MEKNFFNKKQNYWFSEKWMEYLRGQFYISLKVEILLKNIYLIIILIILSSIQIWSYPYNSITFESIDGLRFKYLKEKYGGFLDTIPFYNHTHQTNKTIYWCWFQGVEKAPILYLMTLNSIKKNLKDFNLLIINETNMFNLVEFPPYIKEKYQQNIITRTHLSDMLRCELLLKYGGTWIDASVLITGYTPEFYNTDLFFFQEKNPYCAGSSWFMTSEKGNPILRTALEILYEYWKTSERLYNYYLFHYFVKMACDRYIKDLKKIPYYSNKEPQILKRIMNKKFSDKKYQKIISRASVHKLTIKRKVIYRRKNTFFQHIFEEYYIKFNEQN